jgi:hypothetical protein
MPLFGWLEFGLRCVALTVVIGLNTSCVSIDRALVHPLTPYADISHISEDQARAYVAVYCLIGICAIPAIAVCYYCMASGRRLAMQQFGAPEPARGRKRV